MNDDFTTWGSSFQSWPQAARAAFDDLVLARQAEAERIARVFYHGYGDVLLSGRDIAQIIREGK